MNDDMKYISVDSHICREVYIFPSQVKHNDFAQRMQINISDIKGAGFVRLNGGKPVCYGHSTTLDIGVDPLDTMMLLHQIGWDDD